MYRRPRSLEVLLSIRADMSAECGYDIRAFVEMVRTGILPTDVTRTVTREEGAICEELQPEIVADAERVDVSEQ
jgi:hypothetical protein